MADFNNAAGAGGDQLPTQQHYQQQHAPAASASANYVDFNQFVEQHKLRTATTVPTLEPTVANLFELARKSKLMASAAEFVPQAAKLPAFGGGGGEQAPTTSMPPHATADTPMPTKPAQPVVVDLRPLVEGLPRLELNASQGAIRKQYANNNAQTNQQQQQQPAQHRNHFASQDARLNNNGGGVGAAGRRPQNQQPNGAGEPSAVASSSSTSGELPQRSTSWRDQHRPAGGSGRTQSQFNDGFDAAQASAQRRNDVQHREQRGARGGGANNNRGQQQQHADDRRHLRSAPNPFNRNGNETQSQGPAQAAKPSPFASKRTEADARRSANPFDRRNHEQQFNNSRPSSSASNNHHHHQQQQQQQQHQQHKPPNAAAHKPSPFASQRGAADRQPQRADEPPSANTNSDASPPNNAAAAGDGHHFDKRRHPEFKPNRNLAPPASHDRDGAGGECSQREKLVREIDAGRLECLVCCEYIKPAQSTWCCAGCFHIIHLQCIIKWARSSADAAGWRCPACQHVTKAVPDAYWCFCGAQRNPQYNRNDVAHSCGDLCGKLTGCPHPCTLLCHPGPCATCHAMVERRCGCGKTKRTQQCNQKEEVPCALPCEKLLGCGEHRCEAACHAGECAPCTAEMEHRCHCGKDRRQVACDVDNRQHPRYSCKKLCNRQLACRVHKCKRVCHADDCGDCQLAPELVRTCPCGRQPVAADQRKSCADPVPLCAAVCGRVLQCGAAAQPHRCAARCHQGACPPCARETAVRCRCGGMEQLVKCRALQTRSDDGRCKKRCTRKRNCGKHKCNQECCIDVEHACPLPCTFQLSCGKHKCDQLCHKGRCQRCMRSSFVELYCECGAQVIYPPVPCGSKRPACDRPCSRRHACEHPVQHNCHGQAQCPPCMAFVATRCFGGHEERKTIACSQGAFSCGLKCGRALRCGRHRCLKTCHEGVCEKEAAEAVGDGAAAAATAAAERCRQPCGKVRVMCGHRCAVACHEGDCPDVPCREQVEVLCECGNRKGQRTCVEFANEYRRVASARFASTMDEMQGGGAGSMVELADVLGPIKLSNNKTLECNEDCKQLERNRRLALGLQIRNPDTAAKYAPKYSEFAKTWARKDPQLVGMIHDKLTELVKLAKQSQQRSRSHSFPTMNKDKRQLVHEMCATFGIESVAYDAEPNRNVVATAQRDTSWLPSLGLLEMLKRESGQRRIPVPMLNAWGQKR